MELLRYYSLEFQIPEKIISVRTNADLWRDLKDWPKKRIAIEGMHRMMCAIIICLDMKHINAHLCFLLRSIRRPEERGSDIEQSDDV